MMARVAAWGVVLLVGLLLPASVVLLIHLQGLEALLALSAADMAALLTALFLPLCLLLLIAAGLAQRSDFMALHKTLVHQASAAEGQRRATESLAEECRAHTALLQEQVRLAIAGLGVQQQQADATQALSSALRRQNVVGEWGLVVAELNSILAAMWRLVHGWAAPGPGGPQMLTLPPPEELPLSILRLLPPTARDMERFDVDERFVRQAARYRATFRAFLEKVPEAGAPSKAVFRDLVYGRLDSQFALLPRPNHARVIDPKTLAAE
jgi:hypothetical protein